MKFANFAIQFDKAIKLLPDEDSRRLFMATLVGSLSVHVDDDVAMRCMERSLDEAQGWAPTLQLIKGGKR